MRAAGMEATLKFKTVVRLEVAQAEGDCSVGWYKARRGPAQNRPLGFLGFGRVPIREGPVADFWESYAGG